MTDRRSAQGSEMVPVVSDAVWLAGAVAVAAVGGSFAVAFAQVGALTAAQLKAVMPAAKAENITRFLGPINAALRTYGISSREQRAAFFAHVSVECKQLNEIVEDLYYSAKRLTVVWPKRFKTIKAAQDYAGDPEKLANKVYGGRKDLGHGDAESGDGYLFRGRGLLQVAGRYNYRMAGFENNPGALEDPNKAADTAGHHWKSKGLNERTNKVLTRAEFNATTLAVNGGTNGSNERWAAYLRVLKALQPPSSPPPRRP